MRISQYLGGPVHEWLTPELAELKSLIAFSGILNGAGSAMFF